MSKLHTFRHHTTSTTTGSQTVTGAPETFYQFTGVDWNTYRTINLPDPKLHAGKIISWGYRNDTPVPSVSWQLTGHINGTSSNANFSSGKECSRGSAYSDGTTWIVF